MIHDAPIFPGPEGEIQPDLGGTSGQPSGPGETGEQEKIMGRKIAVPVDVLDWDLWRGKAKALHVYLTLVRMCNFRSTLGSKCQVGQCLIGREFLAHKLGMPPSTLEDQLRLLIRSGLIAAKSDSKSDRSGRVVTVIHYSSFDGFDPSVRQKDRHESDSTPTVNRQHSDISTALQPIQPNNQAAKRKKEIPPTPLSRKGATFRSMLDVELPAHIDSPEVRASLTEWLQYKGGVKQIGMTKLIKKVSELTPERIVAAVDHSIAQKYVGLFEPHNGNGQSKLPGFQPRELTWEERHESYRKQYGGCE